MRQPESISDAINEIIAANLNVIQTAIKCAICGRENLGKNMDVIYEAPLNPIAPQLNAGMYRYPKNIVKAICPKHNRKGTVGVSYIGR